MEEDLVVNKNMTNYPDTVVETYNYLKAIYGYNARMTIIWQLLANAFGLKEFDILDYYYVQNGAIMSWLIDQQIDWMHGKDVNMSEVYRAILQAGDFTSNEKLQFKVGNIEEKLWAIFLLITSPSLEL